MGTPVGRLVDHHPALAVDDLVESLVPPSRFANVRFDTYIPDEAHPSQAQVCESLDAFVEELAASAREGHGGGRGLLARLRGSEGRARAADGATRRGRYLDGGYGVGKTHLLASAWHRATEAGVSAAYLSFGELTSIIGFLGMEAAIHAFGRFRLLCLDEFELDDVANTLMAVTFLRATVAEGGARVVTTSNSLPDRLGEGRFHAQDFRREIRAIADHFEVARIDGDDYRARARHEADTCTPAAADQMVLAVASADRAVTCDGLAEVLGHLRRVHPVQYRALVEGIDLVALRAMAPIANQGDALLFVHLVDELYDAEVPVVAEGCAIGDLFPDSYRHGGYRKKYGRCESRLAALCAEATVLVERSGA